MSVILPRLSTWFLANYFTPLVLIALFALLGLFLAGQWFFRHFYDLVKFFLKILIAGMVIGLGVWFISALFQEKSLMFTMIEYFSFSLVLWLGLTFLVFVVKKNRLPASFPSRSAVAGQDASFVVLEGEAQFFLPSPPKLVAKKIGYQKDVRPRRAMLTTEKFRPK